MCKKKAEYNDECHWCWCCAVGTGEDGGRTSEYDRPTERRQGRRGPATRRARRAGGPA